MDLRITALEESLVTLASVSDVNYPTVRNAILQAGGDDFISSLRLSLPPVRIVEVDEFDNVTVRFEEADPFEVEKEILGGLVKNELHILYAVRRAYAVVI